jgi:hypothetical protein
MRRTHRTLIINVLLGLAAAVRVPVTAEAQTPSLFWGQNYGGDDNSSGAFLQDVTTDSQGNVIITGSFTHNIDFGGGLLYVPFSSYGDIFLAKFSPAGNHLWSKSFGDGTVQVGRAVAVDADDNVILAGMFSDLVNFGTGTLTCAGGVDIFVAKFNPQGVNTWSSRYGDNFVQNAYDIAVDADGDIVLVGSFNSSVSFGGGVLTSAGSEDAYIARFDAGGTHLWSQRFGGVGTDEAWGVAIGVDGNVGTVGDFENNVDFGGGVLTGSGGSDAFAAVHDAAGAHVWSRRFGDANDQQAVKATFDSAGDLVLTGSFGGSVDFGGGALSSAGDMDVFLAKLDEAGAHVWSRRFGDLADQLANDVAVDEDDRVFAVGRFEDSIDLGGGVLNVTGTKDGYFAVFDAAGTHVWSRRIGGAGGAYCQGVDVGAHDVITVAGHFNGSVDLGGGARPTIDGNFDPFIARYVPNAIPVISAVDDVPADQGGYIDLSWNSSGADIDVPTEETIDRYTIWRAISPEAAAAMLAGTAPIPGAGDVVAPTGLPRVREQAVGASTYYWYLVDTVDASFLTSYSSPVATLFDSTAASPEMHYFQVIAHTGDPYNYFVSAPDSGYSVDNLAPGTPQGLTATQLDATSLELVWRQNSEADLSQYAVYRGSEGGFIPGPASLRATTPDTSAVDTGWQWSASYYYKVSALDIHGNESGFALLAPDDVTDVGETPGVARTYLAQNIPNPFNPTTCIAFGLDAPQNVTLSVYDARGARVRTLVSGEYGASRRHVVSWDGRDDRGRRVASGVYFFRLSGDHVMRIRKAVLLK